MSSSPATENPLLPPTRRKVPLHTKIMIGLLLGITAGVVANIIWSQPVTPGVENLLDLDANGVNDRLDWVALNLADPVGKIFLRLMFMVVLPLVFSALALAVVEIGDVRRLGRMGLETLLFSGILSVAAVVLGVALVNGLAPGKTLSPEKREDLQQEYARDADRNVRQAEEAKSLRDTLIDIIPENPLQEMVGAVDGSSKGNGMLAVMFFSLVLGAAITVVPDRCGALVGWLEGLYAVSMVIIEFAMRLAPLGAGCLVFSITARLGFEIVITLMWFVLTAMIGYALHLLVVYPLVIWLLGRRNPWKFFRDVSEAMLVAFGTSSSGATLPTALRVAQDELKLPREVSNFVLTVGATGNQNGTALYEGVVVLFLAQVFGVDLSLSQQLMVVLMAILAGVGTAGVPGGSLPLIVVLLQSVGVPGSGIGIILGVDRILDMCRTVLNVTGDLVVATCVAARESTGKPE